MKHLYAVRKEDYNLHMLELVDLIVSPLGFQNSFAVNLSKQMVFSYVISVDPSFCLKFHGLQVGHSKV